MRDVVKGGLMVAALAAGLFTSVHADARSIVMVHGRNSGTSDTTDYWHIGAGANNDGLRGFSGNNGVATAVTRTSSGIIASANQKVYSYDATNSWSNLSSNTMPVCALTAAMNATPGTDVVVDGHSAGGLVATYMLAVAQNGWANSCAVSPATGKSWTTYVITNAAPFKGAQVADAVYGGTSGNWLQIACGAAAGAIANLLYNQATNMTWALQRSYMATYNGSLVAYGSYGSIYANAGTSASGDDSTLLGLAASCAGEESNNDGFVSCNSALDTAKGGACGTVGLPYNNHMSTNEWYDGTSHSSNRRDDYHTGGRAYGFASNSWRWNPY